MKKKVLTSVLALALCGTTMFSICACGGGGDSTNSTGNSSESGMKNAITASALTAAELGEGFNEKYIPDTASIKQLSGKIDVNLDFEGTQAGWEAVAEEYERLQGNAVIVNIDDTYSGTQYSNRLMQEFGNNATDWDIVEGNLGYGSTNQRCIDMYASVAAPNPYCGKNVQWKDVLQRAAYRTKEADTSNQSYILNSEVMQTCWFVNDVALRAAGDEGYVNSEGKAEYPITWDDLISLCDYMQKAGYSNPLGITLCEASINSLQFTWLLRVYGDYYYRQFYKYIMDGEVGAEWENYDGVEEVVERNDGYGVKYAKLLNLLFADKNVVVSDFDNVGFTSELYIDFVSQLAKMKGHLMKDVASTEFTELRDQFEAQSGKDAPQIILDYQGFGINYEKSTAEGFELGYFDYPQMITGTWQKGDRKGEPYVDHENTITRDIGGNGGFLSVINHLGDADQNELNKDFIKFFMSPYGQTIYYKGLAADGAVPKGLSSVKNELVVIPSEWKAFFEESNKTIKFSGDVDANSFLSWGVRYAIGYTATQNIIVENWRNLLMPDLAAGQSLTVEAFAGKWDTAVRTDIEDIIAFNKWPKDFWKTPSESDL